MANLQKSQPSVNYLVAAKRVAILHSVIPIGVVLGVMYAPFAPILFQIWYTVFFSVVAIVPILNNWKCPLTEIEKNLIRKGGETPYDDTFIPHYTRPYIPFVAEWQVDGFKIIVFISLCRIWHINNLLSIPFPM